MSTSDSKVKWLTEAVILLTLTASGYVTAYVYQLGIFSFYKLPKEFIELTTENIVIAGLFSSATIIPLFASLRILPNEPIDSPRAIKALLMFLLWVLPISFVVIYGNSLSIGIMFLAIGLSIIIYRSRMFPELLDVFGARFLLLGVAILTLCAASFLSGVVQSRGKQQYPILDDRHLVILGKFSNYLVCKEFELINNQIRPLESVVLMGLDDVKGEKIYFRPLRFE